MIVLAIKYHTIHVSKQSNEIEGVKKTNSTIFLKTHFMLFKKLFCKTQEVTSSIQSDLRALSCIAHNLSLYNVSLFYKLPFVKICTQLYCLGKFDVNWGNIGTLLGKCACRNLAKLDSALDFYWLIVDGFQWIISILIYVNN